MYEINMATKEDVKQVNEANCSRNWSEEAIEMLIESVKKYRVIYDVTNHNVTDKR